MQKKGNMKYIGGKSVYIWVMPFFHKQFCNFQLFKFYISFIQNYTIYLETFGQISPMIKVK